MTETYTRIAFSREVAEKLERDVVRLDADDQLFYNVLQNELDALLRQPHMRSVNKIKSYSRAQRVPLI